MHLQDASEPLALALGRVHNRLACFQVAGIHPEEAELSDEGVGHDLEGECRERRLVVGFAGFELVRLGILAFHRRNIQRGGHVIHDCIQKLLYAFVFIGSAAGHGNHFHRNRGFADGIADFFRRYLLTRQITLHDVIVEIGDRLQEFVAIFCRQLAQVFRNLLVSLILAEVIVVDARLHIHQVDNTLEAFLPADRKLNGNRIALQSVMYHIQHMIEIGAHDIHLVHVNHTGNMIVVRLPPDSLGLRLHAALCT